MIILVVCREVGVREDRRLIRAMRRGSREALERLYEKYASFLLTVALALCHRLDAAEDVVHDFFVSFVASAGRVKAQGNLRAYMAICVANLARDRLRRERRGPGYLDDEIEIEADTASPEQQASKREQAVALNWALSQLPFEQKEVIVLHVHGRMKFTQIARQRGRSVNTVRSQYRYGIRKMSALLNHEVVS
ncbi:MAG: sigma-70 family RNA polymerase sigma factor [Phycisphaerales bacterium]|nr:MAG: sigma-70 family RNA polymerase sigma factor [Phycisphaerales bacterium]